MRLNDVGNIRRVIYVIESEEVNNTIYTSS